MANISRRNLLLAGVAAIAVVGYGGWWAMNRQSGPAPTHQDLVYADVSAANKLDIYLPEGAGPFPFVIDIHGGAFKVGDKAGEAVSSQVLAQGIAIVRVNYRLTDEAIWPAQQDDILAAVAYLRANGAEYGLDASRMALWGQSAGGFLAVMTAVELVRAGTPPQAVVDFFGPMDFGQMDADMVTLGRTAAMGNTDPADSAESVLMGAAVGENREAATAMGPIGQLPTLPAGTTLPPLMIRHGDADTFIAHLQSERLRDAWAATDPAATIDFALVAGAGHGGGDFNTDVVHAPLAAFLAAHLG